MWWRYFASCLIDNTKNTYHMRLGMASLWKDKITHSKRLSQPHQRVVLEKSSYWYDKNIPTPRGWEWHHTKSRFRSVLTIEVLTFKNYGWLKRSQSHLWFESQWPVCPVLAVFEIFEKNWGILQYCSRFWIYFGKSLMLLGKF